MSVALVCKKKIILRVQNSIFSELHEALLLLSQTEVLRTGYITKLLEDTDQEIYGSGAVFADIAEYFKTKNEALVFADLVKQAIKMKYDYFNRYEGCIARLNTFHDEIIKYGNELKG